MRAHDVQLRRLREQDGRDDSQLLGGVGQWAFTARSSSTSYAPQGSAANVNGVAATAPDGAFATTATNALNQSETRRYDPRFGALISMTGLNGLTTNWQVDDESRKLKEIRADGTGTRSESCLLPGRVADVSSNPSTCASSVPGEAPRDAVMYVQSVTLDTAGNANGPWSRVYSDRLGREVRSATQSYDGNGQGVRIVVRDTRYGAYGAVAMATQPYFLDSGSSLAGGGVTFGRTMTTYDTLGRPLETRTSDPQGQAGAAGFPDGAVLVTSRTTFSYNGYATEVTDDKGRAQLTDLDQRAAPPLRLRQPVEPDEPHRGQRSRQRPVGL